jgi:serine/threonine protein phosphatase PrpC
MALESYKNSKPENSGSCAIVALFVDDKCYIANVGDSRAVLSLSKGNNVITVSKDHKPCALEEQERILKAGGKLY